MRVLDIFIILQRTDSKGSHNHAPRSNQNTLCDHDDDDVDDIDTIYVTVRVDTNKWTNYIPLIHSFLYRHIYIYIYTSYPLFLWSYLFRHEFSFSSLFFHGFEFSTYCTVLCRSIRWEVWIGHSRIIPSGFRSVMLVQNKGEKKQRNQYIAFAGIHVSGNAGFPRAIDGCSGTVQEERRKRNEHEWVVVIVVVALPWSIIKEQKLESNNTDDATSPTTTTTTRSLTGHT